MGRMASSFDSPTNLPSSGAALHARIDDRDHSVEQIRSRLEAGLALAQRDRSQWESRTTELSRRAEDLGAQARGAATESLRDLERQAVALLRTLGVGSSRPVETAVYL